MASTNLSRSMTSTSTTWTLSVWVKRALISSTQYILSYGGSGTEVGIGFSSSNKFQFYAAASGTNPTSTGEFTDLNGWYHAVVKNDAGTITLYMNGETLTNTGGNTGAALNSSTLRIGDWQTGAYDFNGSMSHLHFIDGTAYSASTFGSTDSTTGEWKINTAPSVTYGSDGFFILKDGNSVTDQSGQGNNLTVAAGTLTKTEDNPSNIFCTGNPLARFAGNINYSNGNNFITGAANNWTMGSATMGASSGKYYYECKILSAGTGSGYTKIGFVSDIGNSPGATGGHPAETALDGGYAFYQQNGNLEVRTDSAVISGYSNSDLGIALTNNDIMCLAVDMDNKKAYFRKNGDAWIKSANPVTGTNGLDISSDYPAGSTKMMIPAWGIYYPGTAALNFGNGYFGTTAVSSAGTNASNLGIFEFDVPTGYTALCTKGLNE